MDWIDLGFLSEHLNRALDNQVTQFTIGFMLAAWLHSGRVKKEFSKMTEAINNLSTALRQDLKAQADRISGVEVNILNISTRVEAIETKIKEE